MNSLARQHQHVYICGNKLMAECRSVVTMTEQLLLVENMQPVEPQFVN